MGYSPQGHESWTRLSDQTTTATPHPLKARAVHPYTVPQVITRH